MGLGAVRRLPWDLFGRELPMSVADMSFVAEFVQMANDGWLQGWHECNGGNLSYLLDEGEGKVVAAGSECGEWVSLPDGAGVPEVAGSFVMMTASGSYFRDVARKPEECCGIIEVAGSGLAYRHRWGFSHGGRPTSELPSHLLALAAAQRDRAEVPHRVVYHCHPASLIALTFVLPLDSSEFTDRLTKMISECKIVFPRGLGVVGWMEPGSIELGRASVEQLAAHDAVVWAHHGLFCTAPSFKEAFGLAHTVEKSSEILVKVISMAGLR